MCKFSVFTLFLLISMISYRQVFVKKEKRKKEGIFMTKDLDIIDNKIIILYILDTSSKPLTIEQIVKFCEEFDDITYFDICSYLDSLKNSHYITEKTIDANVYYSLTESGINTLHELLELIPGMDLYHLKKMVQKNLVEVNTDYSIDTVTIPIKEDEYNVSCVIKDGNDELVNITLYAGNKEQARNIAKNWNENAESIYQQLLEMMTKDM